MTARDTPAYKTVVEELPENYRERYHELLLRGVMYTIMLFDVRRGREGMVDLKRTSYEKRYNDVLARHYYQKVRGELSKNHRKDCVSVVPFNCEQLCCLNKTWHI